MNAEREYYLRKINYHWLSKQFFNGFGEINIAGSIHLQDTIHHLHRRDHRAIAK